MNYFVEKIRYRHNNIEAMDKWQVIDYVQFAKEAHHDRAVLLSEETKLRDALMALVKAMENEPDIRMFAEFKAAEKLLSGS